MSQSITTSIRLSPEMRRQLEEAAYKLHRGKNWIINEALNMYLREVMQQGLAEEARQQSLLANQAEQDTDWEDSADTTGWV